MALLEKIVAAAWFRIPQRPAAVPPRAETVTLFVGHGRWILADDLGSADPFCLLPGQIVDRVLLAGYRPSPDVPGHTPLGSSAKAEDVERDGRRFRVWRDPDNETITVQEIRAAAADVDGVMRGDDPG